eukprot:COSAG06_NODE_243_length_19221_cov_15.057578_20_plen_57_part_00
MMLAKVAKVASLLCVTRLAAGQDCATPNAAGDADCANFVSSNGCDPMFNFGGDYGG